MMRLAAVWTRAMAIAIALDAMLLIATAFGGGWQAWVLAVPAMFFGLQVLGLPVVLLCELGAKLRLLPRDWRPVFDEVLIVAALCVSGWFLFDEKVAIAAAGFFTTMYLVRILARKAWRPGEAVEVGA